MNKYHTLSILFFIGGLVFFLIGVFTGNVEAGFFLVFPFFVGSGIYSVLGIIFVFIAILLFMFGYASTAADAIGLQFEENKHDVESKKSVKGGGVVLVGPIPIVFGSNWKIAVIMMVLAILLTICTFLAFRFL
ncbi:MAG: TIGR00304 family protein [Thermoplasmatales archaeon]|nr:MAG: TIGR00304 family protein [Thermoplasmatales archaeon]